MSSAQNIWSNFGQFYGFSVFSTILVMCASFNLMSCLEFQWDNQPSVAWQSLWPSFLANSSDFSTFNHWHAHLIQLQYRTIYWGPPQCLDPLLHASVFKVFPVVHCVMPIPLSSCCCITCAVVDFSTPVISINWWWLMLDNWLLISSSKAVLLASVKFLHGFWFHQVRQFC